MVIERERVNLPDDRPTALDSARGANDKKVG
jgi:hypothetical protein